MAMAWSDRAERALSVASRRAEAPPRRRRVGRARRRNWRSVVVIAAAWLDFLPGRACQT
jgi:hypothetical protein